MAKKTEKQIETHFMGKSTGYDLKDGVYTIAPMYQKQFEEVEVKQAGINALLQAIINHTAELSQQNALVGRKIWKDIIDDLGLDTSTVWEYNPWQGTVRAKTKTPPGVEK